MTVGYTPIGLGLVLAPAGYTSRHELAWAGMSPVPSRSSIYRTPDRHGLVSATMRKRPRSDYVRWGRSGSMPLWQLDIMGSVMIVDNARSVGCGRSS